jgi:hypothetical protein
MANPKGPDGGLADARADGGACFPRKAHNDPVHTDQPFDGTGTFTKSVSRPRTPSLGV